MNPWMTDWGVDPDELLKTVALSVLAVYVIDPDVVLGGTAKSEMPKVAPPSPAGVAGVRLKSSNTACVLSTMLELPSRMNSTPDPVTPLLVPPAWASVAHGDANSACFSPGPGLPPK